MMELPNYTKQLMQHLQTLRKECQFCDCTILVDGTPHPAHKAVLAASSLLFKSLLEGSDSISIDTAVVTQEEFSTLLDMVYTGRLPPGKHNFTRIIAAADSLQMFDVAVGCKNILTDLVKKTQGESVESDVSIRESGDHQTLEPMQLGHSESRVPLAPDEEEGVVELLSKNQEEHTKTLPSIQHWIKTLRTWEKVPIEQRRIVLKCFEENPGADVIFQQLMDHVRQKRDLSAQTLQMVLEQFQSLPSDLESVLMEQKEHEHKGEVVKSSGLTENAALKLTDFLTTADDISVLLRQAAETCKNKAMKEVLLECVGEQDRVQVVERLVNKLGWDGMEEQSLLELLQGIEQRDTKGQRLDDCAGVSLLRKFQNRLSELNLSTQIISQSLTEGPAICLGQKQHIQALLEQVSGVGAVERLLQAALDEGPVQSLTVWSFLNWAAPQNPDLNCLIQEIKKTPDAANLFQTVAQVDVLYKHRNLILDTICNITDLEKGANGLDSDENIICEFLQSCRRSDGMESMKQVLDRVMDRDLHHVQPLCSLLTSSCQKFPQLATLTEQLTCAELEPDVPTQVTADSEEGEEEEEGHSRIRKRTKAVIVSYSCKWCNKAFDFKCRLMRHRKCCALSPESRHRCSECPLMFSSIAGLQQHRSQTHGDPAARKKKSRAVECDLCDKTFKHPSGLLYHKRTEHLEERPYACEECGAKFAANSSLKNHMRLHTGEKPYRCKHCDMSFAVAAALSYHTKKKHAEGKMYSCQYCSATFAQSIELTRHVRTHTGDKPYVCRECGKGFKQANGLSVHLQSFHNVAEPHDCQKCRVSFTSLEELREHIQDVHPKELHQCPECSKILSTATQLEKHMSIHDGSKPYSCKSCQKSYQTLSGLWYHNRTSHPDMVTVTGSRPISPLLRCKNCNKAFCSKSSLLKHQVTKHPEIPSVSEGVDEGEMQTDPPLWRCVYCPGAFGSEEVLQQHVSSEHVSLQGSAFVCVVCSLTFVSEPEFHHHCLTNHLQTVQEEEGSQPHGSASQMVIQTEGDAHERVEPVVGSDQSQQVFVALGDGGETADGSGIVAVNMEDLLAGRITLICEENP